jgi:hypothetical protein
MVLRNSDRPELIEIILATVNKIIAFITVQLLLASWINPNFLIRIE